MPKLREETIGAGDQSWIASTHAIWDGRTVAPIPEEFGSGDFPDGTVPSGTPLYSGDGGKTASPDSADGDHVGFLLTDQKLPADGGWPLFWHGAVNVDRLPVDDFDATAGVGSISYFGAGGEG